MAKIEKRTSVNRSLAAGDAEGHSEVQTIERQVFHRGHVSHSRNRSDTGENSPIVRVDFLTPLRDRWRVEIEPQNVVGTDAEVHVGKIPETVNHQPCARKHG
jgi:hypothetical protein